jgi:hypothetical protein
VWTTTHGYAHLAINGRLAAPGQHEPDPAPDIARFLFGAAARAKGAGRERGG